MCIRIHRGKERAGIMKGGRVHGGGTLYIYIYRGREREPVGFQTLQYDCSATPEAIRELMTSAFIAGSYMAPASTQKKASRYLNPGCLGETDRVHLPQVLQQKREQKQGSVQSCQQ